MALAIVQSNTHLIDTLKPILHTLDGMLLPIFHVLRLKHFTERALSLLSYQAVFAHCASFTFTPRLLSSLINCRLPSIAL